MILLSTIACSGSVAAECLPYGIVSLRGRLVQQTYPGPPDYESVTKGDQPLVIWILQMDRPICVAGLNSSYPSAYGGYPSAYSGYPSAYGEREIQVVLGADQYAGAGEYAQYRYLLGKKITVTGRLQAGGARYEKRFVVVPYEIETARPRP